MRRSAFISLLLSTFSTNEYAHRTRQIIAKLEDPSIDEEDMPDAIKETLYDVLILPEHVRFSLCFSILFLLITLLYRTRSTSTRSFLRSCIVIAKTSTLPAIPFLPFLITAQLPPALALLSPAPPPSAAVTTLGCSPPEEAKCSHPAPLPALPGNPLVSPLRPSTPTPPPSSSRSVRTSSRREEEALSTLPPNPEHPFALAVRCQ
jgi:hypothetical protein